MFKCSRCLGPIPPGWPGLFPPEGPLHYFAHECEAVREDARKGIYICLSCGGVNTVAGTEDNCDNVWCRDCLDFTTDLPRMDSVYEKGEE